MRRASSASEFWEDATANIHVAMTNVAGLSTAASERTPVSEAAACTAAVHIYGTRVATVVVVDRDNRVTVHERQYRLPADGTPSAIPHDRTHSFDLLP